MNWILDGAVAAIILGCAVAAWRKGLIRAVLGFLPMALARNESSKPFYRKIFKGDNPV